MNIENFSKSMQKFKNNNPKLKFGYDLFFKYLQELVDKSAKDVNSYHKLKHYYGLDNNNYIFKLPVNPIAIWISKILNEAELIELFGENSYRNKLNDANNILKTIY